MAKRRGFLRAICRSIGALIALPFIRSTASADEGETDVESADSLVVQNHDSTTVEPADSTDRSDEGSRTVEIPLDYVKELKAVGGSKLVEINGRRILVVRDAEKSVRAFQAECTHKQVTVEYDKKRGLIRCPGHGSRFDLEGRVLRGPAQHQLPTFEARLVSDRIILVLD